MALLHELVFASILFLLTRIFGQYFLHLISRRKLPPGPIGLPMVGALPYLGSMPHVALAQMANKYGPVMYMKIGTCDMVVASSPDSARAFLKTLDMNFSNRPMDGGPTHLAYNGQDMVFADYGHRWRLLRKLSNVHMLGQKALDDWSGVRATEVGRMLQDMIVSSEQGEPVVVSDMLSYTTANMICQAMLSKRVFESKGSETSEFKDMVVELMTIAGYFNIGDFIPVLEPLDLQGLKRKMKCLHKKFDVLISKLIEEHQATTHERKGMPDFVDALLNFEEKSGHERLSITNIKALILNLLTAGTDTSSSAIEWALAELLSNPKILSRAHNEMDMVIGRDRRLKETDIAKLPYLQAICKETFRKHPSTPLNLPRISTEACEVNGYYIPKNARLSVNIWAIGRDSSVWENPTEFTPERFLMGKNAKVDPRGNDFELIPFGAGRRICAGARMGITLVEYILGSLVHSFDWKPAEELNMDETFGLALQKAIPLSALVTPRLSSTAYST